MLHDWQSDKHYCRESKKVLMSIMKETKSGKYIVYDKQGKIVIMSRNKRVCQQVLTRLQTEKE